MLPNYTWSLDRLPNALENLAKRTGLISSNAALLPPVDSAELQDNAAIDTWLQFAAEKLNVETVSTALAYPNLAAQLANVAPALLLLPSESDAQLLLILKSNRTTLTVLTPNQQRVRVPLTEVYEALVTPLEQPFYASLDALNRAVGVPDERQAETRQALLREQLAQTTIEGCWLLRLSPSANFLQQIWHSCVPSYVSGILAASVVGQLCLGLAWWLVGEDTLSGHFQWAWLSAWALLLFSSIPFALLTLWLTGLVGLELGALFKRRLLFGILQLDPSEIRHHGVGQFLGMVMQVEEVETLGITGGLNALSAVTQLLFALLILALGVGHGILAVLLVVWVLAAAGMSWLYYQRTKRWNQQHLRLTHDLVEKMTGHRTRLAQAHPDQWHSDEDALLHDYLQQSRQMDDAVLLTHVIERGWLLLALLVLGLMLLDTVGDTLHIMLSLGGILLARQFFQTFVPGITPIITALIAWQRIEPLFTAATRARKTSKVARPISQSKLVQAKKRGAPVLHGRNLVFRHHAAAPAVIKQLNVQINAGDRVLLEGTSGSGKSTLAALLTGLRSPESGSLALWGVDKKWIDSHTWQRNVVTAAQFHENYVFTDTFAFNLLMGRAWPPTLEDIQEAVAICKELGLDTLLETMPSGLQQMVGENGRQLSHGERSRLAIARTLLQPAEVIILDESFAALDPENLQRALQCVFKRAPTLVVIAHP